MNQLFLIEKTQTATFGGGAGMAVVSPFRVVSTSRPVMEPLGLPFSDPDEAESTLRYYAGCRRMRAALQDEVADATYARLLAGEPVQTGGGIVQIRQA